jgi:hypothetical protein
MEAKSSSSGDCGNSWGGVHEHGGWEAVGGGQATVLTLVGVRGLRIEKGRKLECVEYGT